MGCVAVTHATENDEQIKAKKGQNQLEEYAKLHEKS